MENGTDTIPEGSFRDGDDEVFVSLYRVEQDDLTIGTITLLLPQLSGSFQSQITELNNALAELERRGTMPSLNFANPLHTFSTGNLSYTAVKTCYLLGLLPVQSGVNKLSINGTEIATTVGNVNSETYIPLIKLNAGDTVTLTVASTYLHVFDVVS